MTGPRLRWRMRLGDLRGGLFAVPLCVLYAGLVPSAEARVTYPVL